MIKKYVSIMTAITALAFGSASADMVVFDDESGLAEQIAPTIVVDGITITGALSTTFNTTVDAFDLSDTTAYDVWLDTSPADGGLGVDSPYGTDNFEGSLNKNTNYDEILFFDFGTLVTLQQVIFNAAVGTGHQDLFITSTDIFNVFYSLDGQAYSCIICDNASVSTAFGGDGETLSVGGGAYRWFAVAHVGPVHSDGGYIEALKYRVPEPGTLSMLGLCLIVIGMARRRRKA